MTLRSDDPMPDGLQQPSPIDYRDLERRNRELQAEVERCYEELARLERHLIAQHPQMPGSPHRGGFARLRHLPRSGLLTGLLARLGLRPWKLKHQRAKEIAIVAASDLFDAGWYTQAYPDVAESRMPPAEHYVRHGAAEGRDPGPDFDTLSYLRAHPELRRQQINPLVHFLSTD